MKFKIRFKYILSIVLLLIVLYLFWGPLLAWSPIKFGYEEIKTNKAVILIKSKTPADSVIYNIDEIIKEEESWHDLQYTDNFKIIIVDKDADMRRHLPWLKGKGHSVCIGFANLVYIGANARKSEYGIGTYIKHELSHLLIHQNTPSKKDVFEMQEQGWFTEGLATYFGGPEYFTKKEFVDLCFEKGLDLSSLNEANIIKVPVKDKRILYTHYRYFIEYLVNNYGLEKLQEYIKRYIDNPSDYENLFVEVYKEELVYILKNYDKYISFYRWKVSG